MKVWLKQPIVGIAGTKTRVHANANSVLSVILHNHTHYICDSVNYPGTHVVVFPSQCHEVIRETLVERDDIEIDKYYGVYEPKSIPEIENDSPYSTLQFDDE